ncbi:hypothetical protein [Streptomyces sp. JNUCC 63]
MTANRTKTVTIATTFLVLAAILIGWVALAGRSDPTSPQRKGPGYETDDAVDLVARVDAFTAGFRDRRSYQPPTRVDRDTVAQGVLLFLDGRHQQAQQRLATVDFEIRTLVDRGTGRRFAEVFDRSEDGSAPRGWGRVYLPLDSPARWSVQVPHPIADQATERLGAHVLLSSHGGVMIIAGAHRNAGRGDSADMAHRRDSVFDAVCARLAERGFPGLQIHGFAADSAPDYDVIASTGRGRIALAEGRTLANALRDQGFSVCRAWVRNCPLEGRTNVQGRKAAAQHVPFLHVEFGIGPRTDEQLTARVVEAVGRLTTDWARA